MNKTKSLLRHIAKCRKKSRYKQQANCYVSGSCTPIATPFDIDDICFYSPPAPRWGPDWTSLFMHGTGWMKDKGKTITNR